MHHPNQILGAERAMGIGSIDSGAVCGVQVAQNTCSDRQLYVRATVDVRATSSFGNAFSALQDGRRITRAGWNGANQHVEIQWPDKHSRMTRPYAALRNSDGDLVPWVPSQGDLFANDWAVLPS